MNLTELGGQATSRLGFGCGRLVGGAGMRGSVALVEAALELGIRHFDTAPSYGLGTSEDVLGTALAGVDDVTIVTKVGQSRPKNGGAKALARQILRPLLSLTPGLKTRVAAAASGRAQTAFNVDDMRASIAESLRRLRREAVTGVLLHEIPREAMTDSVAEELTDWRARGLVAAAGSGTGLALDSLVPFGDIAQFMWQPRTKVDAPRWRILHGALRHYPRPDHISIEQIDLLRQLGRDPADPAAWSGALLTLALMEDRSTILLVSSTEVSRLRIAVNSIDWSMAATGESAAIDLHLALLGLNERALNSGI